ncbi:hypothetical protein HJC23_010707 [Cyclotella cryptica]|uniref:HD domain-containing protein n=1 Tax=Cyclotella cryptica TaxID=29204 RepID=A0ABD3PDL4_9STRA|eukprot:CCRYP_015440-RA/>CCRYP_015440-RA protein AED:0.00 eAED:0.00 QI:273/-1/1/1/-1/1/1/497/257
MTRVSLILAVCAIAFMRFMKSNPVLFGRQQNRKTPDTANLITRDKPNKILKDVLLRYGSVLGEDYDSYYNHCLRVLNFSKYFLDKDTAYLKGTEMTSSSRGRNIDIMAFALAYHDIALWTDGELNYLEPSVAVMERDLQENRSIRGLFRPPLTTEEKLIAREIIMQHHKISSFSASKADLNLPMGVEGEQMVNAVRRGDWVDASMGVVKHGISADILEAAYVEIPEAGFHNMLLAMGGRLSPDSIIGQLKVLKILKL